MRDIRDILGEDLLNRPHHGRIRLHGQWIHFPLKPLDLFFKLPWSFTARAVADLIAKPLKKNVNSHNEESFASVLKAGLGRTICSDFYFPYAQKIWGLPPEEISSTQARRRVSANSLGKMLRKIFAAAPGLKPPGSGHFFYPRGAFGQISECLYQAAKDIGAEFYLGAHIKSIKMNGKSVNTVCFEQEGQIVKHRADYVWSTIPISNLLGYLPFTIQHFT